MFHSALFLDVGHEADNDNLRRELKAANELRREVEGMKRVMGR